MNQRERRLRKGDLVQLNTQEYGSIMMFHVGDIGNYHITREPLIGVVLRSPLVNNVLVDIFTELGPRCVVIDVLVRMQ